MYWKRRYDRKSSILKVRKSNNSGYNQLSEKANNQNSLFSRDSVLDDLKIIQLSHFSKNNIQPSQNV